MNESEYSHKVDGRGAFEQMLSDRFSKIAKEFNTIANGYEDPRLQTMWEIWQEAMLLGTRYQYEAGYRDGIQHGLTCRMEKSEGEIE